jgi:Ran GTPase-activating protein (RanGAP) involved in mRNA processing and transport
VLADLDLSHNDLGSLCGASLASLLSLDGAPLEKLSLWSTGLGDQGAGALAGSLYSNNRLRHLELGMQGIGPVSTLPIIGSNPD